MIYCILAHTFEVGSPASHDCNPSTMCRHRSCYKAGELCCTRYMSCNASAACSAGQVHGCGPWSACTASRITDISTASSCPVTHQFRQAACSGKHALHLPSCKELSKGFNFCIPSRSVYSAERCYVRYLTSPVCDLVISLRGFFTLAWHELEWQIARLLQSLHCTCEFELGVKAVHEDV